ncbi:hypothetical protein [Lactobacillus equicursoris]|uniref:hypothetical protein n=1 Tax=Lactobacillus equicursoris TaxID=420645 RepID=UPI002431AA0A|nr:hypothetical protein [Lactobacillus equicursoris]MDD6386583.1 hypothetical protein [Lactobacillus equicursoris]
MTEETQSIEVTKTQAEMITDLLSNFTYAYRSDVDVDCQRELVEKAKVGKYPYPPDTPAADLKQPTYDWINATWVEKAADTIKELSAQVDGLQASKEVLNQQNAALLKMVSSINANFGGLSTTINQLAQQLAAKNAEEAK